LLEVLLAVLLEVLLGLLGVLLGLLGVLLEEVEAYRIQS